jgi:hypothetical protein
MPKAIDDCDGTAGNGEDHVGIEFQMGLVANGDECPNETKTITTTIACPLISATAATSKLL